uniref:Uncharacterized protein n=1 Tax=Oryza sativa subsp. japonica TaxID=39947 RepID=Q6K2C4_ORYSJ|nr:hypothetical protein [Oryza sativa Japonica Group]BAD23692.1 hypothetical protein [Oryza sativa Japonica Group]
MPASTRFPSTAIGTTSPPCNLSPPLAAELRPPLLATLATAKPRHRHSRLHRSKPSTGHRLVPLIHHRAALPSTNQSHRRHFRLRPRRAASSVRPVLCRRPPRYRSHRPWLSNPSVFAGRRWTHLPVPPGPSDHRPPVPAHGTPPNRRRRCLPEERRRLFPSPATSRSASSARTLGEPLLPLPFPFACIATARERRRLPAARRRSAPPAAASGGRTLPSTMARPSRFHAVPVPQPRRLVAVRSALGRSGPSVPVDRRWTASVVPVHGGSTPLCR